MNALGSARVDRVIFTRARPHGIVKPEKGRHKVCCAISIAEISIAEISIAEVS